MNSRTDQTTRMRRALTSCAAAGALLTGSGLQAQSSPPPADDAEKDPAVETVFVTGSRLSAAEFEGGLPVNTYTSVDIEKTTAMSLNNYLRTIPTSYGSDNVDEGTVNGGDGRATIGLRGLPTVTLVNGRRTTTGDLNTIPLIAIDRVEILKDGNGAVYGADAVGGVVNIITKKNFEGVQFNASYQNTTDKDISRRRFEAIYGANNPRGSVVFGVSYFEQNDLFSIDRDSVTNTADRSFGATSAIPNPGRFVLTEAQAQSMFGPSAVAGSYRVNNTVTAATTPSDFRIGQYGNVPPEQSDRFTFSIYTPTVRPAERRNFFGSVNYWLVEDVVEFYSDLFYTRSFSQAALAPSPASFSGSAVAANDFRIPANYYWNQQVFGANAVDITNWSYRFVDFGPRTNDVQFDDTALTLGFRGEITDRIGYDFSWFWNRNEQVDKELNGLNRARLQEILQGRNSTFTGARSFNPFTNPFDSGVVSNDEEMLQYIKLEPKTERNYLTDVRDLSVNARPFDLPAGSVSVVGGYQIRNETFERIPDLAKQQATGSGWNATSFESTDYTVKSLYAEALVPIVADAPLMRRLQIGGAIRREDFSHLEDTATVSRLYLRNEFSRELTARLSYSEGYTAPTPLDLSPAVVQSFPDIFMPWLGVSDQTNQGVQLVGNADLRPTKSESINLGLAWSPKRIKGFSVTLDIYDATQTDIIIQDPQLIVDAFDRGGGLTQNANGTFTKNNSAPFASQVNVDTDGSVTGIAGYIIEITGVDIRNIAELSARGVDLEARYELTTTNAGTFTWRLNLTHVLSYEIEKLPGLLPATEYDGFFTPNDSVGPETVPKWRGFLTMDWVRNNLNAGIKLNYVGSYKEDPDGGTDYTNTVKAWPTFDFTIGYSIPKWKTSVQVGVENLFDKMPPIAESSFADKYDRSAHNILGRMISISATQRF